MADDDLRTFIGDITRRNERIFQEHLKQWEKLHERADRAEARAEGWAQRLDERLKLVQEEGRAQREGIFKLTDAIRDLEEGLGGASA